MDITSGLLNVQRANVLAKVQFAAARKVLDVQKESGNAAVELIRAATSGIDAAASGLGRNIDVQA